LTIRLCRHTDEDQVRSWMAGAETLVAETERLQQTADDVSSQPSGMHFTSDCADFYRFLK